MATYFCSDLHGEYELFLRLLAECGVGDEDVVYVLGDVLDKGRAAFRLLDYVMRRKNFVLVCGNHEETLRRLYEDKMTEYTGDNDREILDGIRAFYTDGRELTWEMIDYVDALPYYIEKEDFICVHAGVQLNADETIVPMKSQSPEYFVYDRKFKRENIVPKSEKCVLFGHTPCSYDNGTGRFIKTLRPGAKGDGIKDYAKIRLDTGVVYTRTLGMLRLEDMKEIYVTDYATRKDA